MHPHMHITVNVKKIFIVVSEARPGRVYIESNNVKKEWEEKPRNEGEMRARLTQRE